MFFWVIIAVLTFAALLAILLPLGRAAGKLPEAIEFDRELYKARVREIERDRDLGRITPEAAEAALAEEGRKLIALAEHQASSDAADEAPSKARYRVAMVASIVLIPAVALSTYLYLGKPGMPDQSLASRMNQQPDANSVEELVERAEAHLAQNPDDARGWSVLAPVYARLGRFSDSVNAWRNVYRIAPETPGIRSTLAESMVAEAQGVVTEQARQLFQAELQDNPDAERARFYLAMALGQEGKHEDAVAAWNELIANGQPEAPWLETARRFRAQAAEAAGIEVAGLPEPPQATPRGPSQQDIAAASEMSAEERMAMISGMIDNLAERLKEDPSDKAGWQRLIRSYIVLGRKEEARAAIAEARKLHGDDAQFLDAINSFSAQLPEG